MARPRLLSPAVFIRRAALYKGLFGGNRGWLAVGSIIWGKGLLKKLFGKNEEILSTEVLKGGQFVRLESLRPVTRRQRKKAKKQEKRAHKQAKVARKQAKVDRKVARKAARKAR